MIGAFRRSGLALSLLLLTAVGWPRATRASTWIVPEPEEMLATADAVVLATVTGVRSVAPDRSGIRTEITLRVHEAFKGARAGDELVIREVGGSVGTRRQWVFGSPEYRVGETVLTYLTTAAEGALRTQHLAIGKVPARIASDGRIWLRRMAPGRGYRTETLSSFVRRLPSGIARAPVVASRPPALEGAAQSHVEHRLLQPPSRWLDVPIALFGDVAGDPALGAAASRSAVGGAAAAWSVPGTGLAVRHAGDRAGSGMQCNDSFVTVSFGDPNDEISDPTSCSGGVLAVGGFCSDGVPHPGTGFQTITSGAVTVNDGWQGCWFWNETNVAETVTHELGHALGLAHSSDAPTSDPYLGDATMYFQAHFDGRGAALAAYDRDAAAFLYPADGGEPRPRSRDRDATVSARVKIAVPHGGPPSLTLTARFSPAFDVRDAARLRVRLRGDRGRYVFRGSQGVLVADPSGSSAHVRAPAASLRLRPRSDGSTAIALSSSEAAVAGLLADTLVLRISAAGRMGVARLRCEPRPGIDARVAVCTRDG